MSAYWPDTAEKHALVDAASVFADHGIDISMPWEGDLDDRERWLCEGFVRACRAYHESLRSTLEAANAKD